MNGWTRPSKGQTTPNVPLAAKTAAELLISQICLIQLLVSIFAGACIECILKLLFMLKFELTKNV